MLTESPIENAVFENFMKSFQPIHGLIEDPSVTEIMINNHQSIWVEQRGVTLKTDIKLEKINVPRAWY